MKSLWTAVAATLLTVSIATAADVTPPDVLAKNTANTLLEELKANQEQFKQNPDQLYEVVDRIVLPHFDFDYVSKLVLARYLRKATPEQRTRFQQAFRSQLVGFYGDALLDYSNEKVRWEDADVPALSGWRRQIFGDDALQLMRGNLALVANGQELELVEFIDD